MENKKLFQKWAGRMIYILAAYDVLVNQFIPQDIRDKYLLYSFGWSLQTWAIIILGSLVITYWWNNRQKDKEPETTKTANAADHSAAIIDSNVRDSFNNNWRIPTPGYETPTRSELIRRIGFEIQEFEDQFDRVRYKQLKNKPDEIVKAREIFEKIRTGILRHAKIELQGTQLITLFESLERELIRYHIQVGAALQNEEDRALYIETDKAYLPTIIERINQSRSDMEKTELNINMAILQIKELCK